MPTARKLTVDDISSRLADLPALPTVVYELSRLISDPMSSTGDIERTMDRDQSLTVKVLRLANSAYYGIPGGVTSLKRAVAYIGFDTIHQLVLASSIINSLQAKSIEGFDIAGFWQHGLGVAMSSEAIARKVGCRVPADLFTAGLIHDIGKLVLLIVEPSLLRESVEFAKVNACSIFDAEEKTLNIRHTQVGSSLAERWRLPMLLQNCILHHHTTDIRKRSSLSPEMNQAVDIVCLANLISHSLRFGSSGHQKVYDPPKDLLDRLGLDESDLVAVIQSIQAKLLTAESFLKVIGV
jgi:putative nucleotidyltransferase with HDIG domain